MAFQFAQGLPKLPDLKTFDLNGYRHYAIPSGGLVPSVTSILGSYSKRSIDAWKKRVGREEADRISADAKDRGETLHKIIEDYIKGTLDPSMIIRSDVCRMFDSMRSMIDACIDDIHYQESCLWSDALGTAGRVDLIARWNGVLSVIDFKSASKEKEERYIQHYFEQATCYALMYEELVGTPIDQIVVLIGVDGKWAPQVFLRNTKDYIPTLMEKLQNFGELV